jgi:multiple sugar transport system ATP-binding protein
MCVDLVEQLGGATMLYATTASSEPITIAIDGQQDVAVGSSVAAYADARQYHVFGADGLAH